MRVELCKITKFTWHVVGDVSLIPGLGTVEYFGIVK